MIEFQCEHCKTHLSFAPDQVEGELFCPACELEITLPELSADMEIKVKIAQAQANNLPTEAEDPEKVQEILQEPDSKETTVWKERLAESFKVTSFKEYNESEPQPKPALPPKKKPEAQKKGVLSRLKNMFSDSDEK